MIRNARRRGGHCVDTALRLGKRVVNVQEVGRHHVQAHGVHVFSNFLLYPFVSRLHNSAVSLQRRRNDRLRNLPCLHGTQRLSRLGE